MSSPALFYCVTQLLLWRHPDSFYVGTQLPFPGDRGGKSEIPGRKCSYPRVCFTFHDVKCTFRDVKHTSLDVKYTFHVVKHKIPQASRTFSSGVRNIFLGRLGLFHQASESFPFGIRNIFLGRLEVFHQSAGTFPFVLRNIFIGQLGLFLLTLQIFPWDAGKAELQASRICA